MRHLVIALLLCLFSLAAAAESRPIALFDMNGDWEAAGDLPWQALILSLQGHANAKQAELYLTYPPDYKHPNVQGILDYYLQRHQLQPTPLRSVEEALQRFHAAVSGVVVWDPQVLPSLMVAFTVSGLENALVVTEAQLPLVKKYKLPIVADFRGKFQGQSDRDIFQWAYDQYFSRCNKDILVYLGEWCTGLNNRPGMRPGIADFGILHRCFFTDLSASPADADEFQLADRIMAEMNDYAYVFGWHSYCKDQEPEHLTLVSKNALVIAEGLATFPNLSFHARLPVAGDFDFKQKALFNPDPEVEDKVYIALIQSDGMGIGSWGRSGRGSIPYGWETNMEWIDFAPALLQYYYETATEQDHFIGSLSGPGYLYPKAYPPDKLPGVLQRADAYMRRCDLHVFGIMDFSEGDGRVGQVDLPKKIVDAYYENMAQPLGFINGYGPANTYDCRDGRPLISYTYYVDIRKTEEQVAEDFRELARLNPQRPFYVPVHVRENNDVERMSKIMRLLGPEFKVVPPEELMILAGKKPNFTNRYLDHHPDYSGTWRLDAQASQNAMSTVVELEIDQRGSDLRYTTTAWHSRFIHHRKLRTDRQLKIGGPAVWGADERTRRMGFLAAWSDSVWTRAEWSADGQILRLITEVELQIQQGTARTTFIADHQLSDGGMTLTINEYRLSRDSDEPVTVFVYRRQLEQLPK
ncbi:MAG TPA: GxGYxYP family putative glycoside hydrolase [bacterium]|nr:GxGYxYP family putative glycoside hydrolase [bacterium]HPG46920.1 GxGYxYP family putative glycoside hydrolase [bacterium]HPM99284.1 GxGYxYP family putative glycoside hydrolase [bacterium]